MKKKNVIYGILLLIGILFLRGYSPAEEIAQEEQKQLGEVIVAIYDYEGVIPEVLIVEPGTMVTWVNCTAEKQKSFSSMKGLCMQLIVRSTFLSIERVLINL